MRARVEQIKERGYRVREPMKTFHRVEFTIHCFVQKEKRNEIS